MTFGSQSGKMSNSEKLRTELMSRTPPFGLRLWIVLGISIWAVILLVLGCICFLLIYWRKRWNHFDEIAEPEIPNVTKEIAVDEVGNRDSAENTHAQESQVLPVEETQGEKDSGKMSAHLITSKSSDDYNLIECSSVYQYDKAQGSYSGDEGSSVHDKREYSQYATVSMSPWVAVPEFSHLRWGHWFTLRDLEHATNGFSNENIIGEDGYGVVYHGHLINGTDVAIKKLFNNMGQAEKEFRVEVEAIGHVRHKNLVQLFGYCFEGSHRMIVYEYISNRNLEQWLHGAMREQGVLTWAARIKVTLGIAKALPYLHKGIEPKVIHCHIKTSNIIIDEEFDGKLSDFGLSKLFSAGKSHITT